MNLSNKVDSIELKVRQLAVKIERLRNENAALIVENRQLKAELDRQGGTVDALKNKLEKTQRVGAKNGEREPEHSEKLRKQIDQYIQEIDRCIEWLHNN